MTGNNDAVAVVGGGGIGAVLAAELLAAGRSVVLCVRTPFGRLEIESGGQTRVVDIRQARGPEEVSPVRWIFLTTKAQDSAGAKPWIDALARPGSTLVVVQNGIDQAERGRSIAGPARVVPAVVYCPAEKDRPGHVVQHGPSRLIVPYGEEGAALAALFAGSAYGLEQADDFVTVTWRKLLLNLVANPVTGLTLRRMPVLHEPSIRELARTVIDEGVAVARCEGARLSPADADALVTGLGGSRSSGGSSMLYDRLGGRPLEHEALTGALVAAADRHGLPVPANRTLLALLRASSGHPLDGTG